MSPVRAPEARYRLPLFPLPVVLLPGTRMPLHIFEQRYQDMVRDALEGDRRFGMVYHDWDEQGPFLSEPGTVGCLAEIREFQPLDDGRSLIVVEGLQRFAIDDGVESETLYFEGLVHPYLDEREPHDPDSAAVEAGDRAGGGGEASDPALVARRSATIELFEAVLASMTERPEQLPDFTPEGEVSFLLAQTIQVDPRWHQELLEMRTEEERLARLDEVFRALLD